MKEKKRERIKQLPFSVDVAIIGAIAGLFASLISYFAFYFRFIRFGPALVLMPFELGDWKDTHVGQLVGVVVITFLSIAIAFLYKVTLQKVASIWAGIFFGLFLWILVFYVINPFLPRLKDIQNLDSNSIITSLCIYILYGAFIGQSISYNYALKKKA